MSAAIRAGGNIHARADAVRVAAAAVDRHSPLQAQREPVVSAAAANPYEQRPRRHSRGRGAYRRVERAREHFSAAVGGYQVGVAVAVQIAVRHALAVLMQACVYAPHAPQRGVVQRRFVLIQAIIVHARYVQQTGAHGDVLEAALPIVQQHAPGAWEHLPAGALPSVHGGAKPVQILVAVVVVVEEGSAEAEVIRRKPGKRMLGGMQHGGVQRGRRHPSAGRYIRRGRGVHEVASAAVSQQKVGARPPSEPARILAVAARLLHQRQQQRMVAYVGCEHIQICVGVVIAERKAHPRAHNVDAHSARRRGEAQAVPAAARRIVAEQMQPIAVVGYPQVGISVVVIVEEQDGMRLSGRFAHAVAQRVHGGGIVALIGFARDGVGVGNRGSVRIRHLYLRAGNARRLRRFAECAVCVVDVEQVVMSRMVVILKHAEVVVQQIADVYVEPAVVVHIGAGDAGGGARVDGVPESGLRNIGKAAVAVVAIEAVGAALLRRAKAQLVAANAPSAHIHILKAVVVDIARHHAGAVAIDGVNARLRRHVREGGVPVVAIEAVRLAVLRCDIEVQIAVAVIVEDSHARAVVPYLIAAAECGGRDVCEGR